MQWLEIIELRTASNSVDQVDTYLTRLFNRLAEDNKVELNIFRNAFLKTDFSVHLQFESDEFVKDYSDLGQQIVMGLKVYGIINHTIWFDNIQG